MLMTRLFPVLLKHPKLLDIFPSSAIALYSTSTKYENTLQTQQSHTNLFPAQKKYFEDKRLQFVMDMIPGLDLKRKLGFIAVSSALVSALVHNDIYIVNNESPLLATFLIVVRFLYIKVGPYVRDFIENEEIKTVRELESAFYRRKNALVSKLEHLKAFQGIGNYFIEYLRAKKENIDLEEEMESLSQQVKMMQETKFKLDEMVRKVAEQKSKERRELIEALVTSILKKLESAEQVLGFLIQAKCNPFPRPSASSAIEYKINRQTRAPPPSP